MRYLTQIFLAILVILIPVYVTAQLPERQTQLLSDLRSEDKRVRRKAAEELGRVGGEKAVAALITALKDPDQMVAAAAALSLGELRDRRAVPALAAVLKDMSEEVRGSAALALGRIGERSTVALLLPLLKDAEVFPRASAVSALGCIGDRQAVAQICTVLVQDPDPQVRTSAAEALGAIADISGRDGLIAALKDQSNYVRTAAAAALGQISSDTAIVSALIEALKDSDRMVRSAAAESLGRSRDERAVRPLIEALSDGDQFVRTSAAFSLGRLGSRQAVDPLIDTLQLDDNRVRARAVEALGAIGDPRAVDVIVGLLRDTNRFVKGNAITALGRIADRKAVDPLLISLSDQDPQMRRAALDSLGRIGDERAFQPVSELLKKETDQNVRFVALATAAKLGRQQSIPMLIEAFSDRAEELRHTAASALARLELDATFPAVLEYASRLDLQSLAGAQTPFRIYFKEAAGAIEMLVKTIGEQDAVLRQRALLVAGILGDRTELLTLGLKDPIADNRALAALMLGRAADKHTVMALRSVVNDEDARVRRYAAEGLARIGAPKYEPPATSGVPEIAGQHSSVELLASTELSPAPRPMPLSPPSSTNPPEVSDISQALPIELARAGQLPPPPPELAEPVTKPTPITELREPVVEPSKVAVLSEPSLRPSPKIPPRISIELVDEKLNDVAPEWVRVEVNSEVARDERVEKVEEPRLNLAARNERVAMETLKLMMQAQKSYFEKNGRYATLDLLIAEGLLDPVLQSGEVSGYELALYVSPATQKRAARYFVIASPTEYGRGGERSFYLDEEGVLRATSGTSKVQVGEVYGSWNRVEN